MSVPTEFVVSKFLSLKLESGETRIYISGKYFRTCAFLLLSARADDDQEFEEMESIDQASERLDDSLEFVSEERKQGVIPAEIEFWGHCSNLQAWTEHDYDTRLLRNNLAFPLLKELTEAGDPLARKVFKEEIAKRIDGGYQPVVDFLIEEQYVNYLSQDELLSVLLSPEDADTMRRLQDYLNDTIAPKYAEAKGISLESAKKKVKLFLSAERPLTSLANIQAINIEELGEEARQNPFRAYNRPINGANNAYAVRDKHVVKLQLSYFPEGYGFDPQDHYHELERFGWELPEFISELTHLEEIYMENIRLSEFPDFLLSMDSLEIVEISDGVLYYSIGFNAIKKKEEEFKKKGMCAWIGY
ncbi:MAG: hypothetical protein JW891_05260 [Candidatus Lokiarchaeota archaeon]|nr:hypothetical protein [Candidatus Lokiarchaeota archaeon]